MKQKKEHNTTQTVTRRAALLRLGLGPVVAYSVPAILTFSEARASAPSGDDDGGDDGGGGGTDGGGTGGGASVGGGRIAPGESEVEADLDLCSSFSRVSSGATLSKRQARRAQKAVARGRALPLRDVYRSVQKKIGGRILEVRFNDGWFQATYDLRMITGKGNLVAVRVQAATGLIMKMSGC